MLDLRFGFLVKNYVYSRLETFGTPRFGQNNAKFSFDVFFVNLISGLCALVVWIVNLSQKRPLTARVHLLG